MSGSNTGAFLGGAAGARDRRKTRELESRRLDIVESQFEAEQQAELLQSVRDRLAGLTEQAVGIVENIPVGRDDPKFHEAIRPLREAIATLSARASENFPGAIDPQSQASLFDSAVSSTPTMSEKAQAEAMAEIEGAKATVSAVGGDDRTLGVLLGTEPLTEPETVRLQEERDTLERSGDSRGAQELTNIINKRGTVVGRTEQDLTVGSEFSTALTTPTEDDIERLRANIGSNQSSFETASNTLKAVQDAGALSVGFVGAGVESFTGIMGNLGALGEAINAGVESLTGADLDKLTQARTALREGVASALPEITEETSGRFTDTEREIANETLRGLTADSNIDQVIAAYGQYFRILNASDVRNAREIIRGAKIDLGTSGALNPAGVDEIGTLLRSLGMAEDRIIEILDQVVPR